MGCAVSETERDFSASDHQLFAACSRVLVLLDRLSQAASALAVGEGIIWQFSQRCCRCGSSASLSNLHAFCAELPVYSLYPAAVKDPVLQSPSWVVLACIFGVALFAAVFFCIISVYSFQTLPKPNFNISKLVLLALLLIGVGSALAYNSYWATFFLVLPSWIWALAGSKRSPGGRVMNRILIVSAGITYYAALVVFASRLHMNWNFVWYQVLALSNGMFTKTAYCLATAIIAIGIRFLAIQSHTIEAAKYGRK